MLPNRARRGAAHPLASAARAVRRQTSNRWRFNGKWVVRTAHPRGHHLLEELECPTYLRETYLSRSSDRYARSVALAVSSVGRPSFTMTCGSIR